MTRYFCLMTMGRSGSTALMHALRRFPDIATPGKNIPCEDDELLHPEFAEGYARRYAELTGRAIESPGALMDAFYRHNAGYAYAGFKSMPNRHPKFRRFVESPGIRFITLVREDVGSTVASFIVAMLTGCWRRDGGEQGQSWTFDPARHGAAVRSNLAYILESQRLIASIPDAIRLSYEELCREDFSQVDLDAYFGRPIRLDKPKPPLSAASYVANWPEFLDFIDRHAHDPQP